MTRPSSQHPDPIAVSDDDISFIDIDGPMYRQERSQAMMSHDTEPAQESGRPSSHRVIGRPGRRRRRREVRNVVLDATPSVIPRVAGEEEVDR